MDKNKAQHNANENDSWLGKTAFYGMLAVICASAFGVNAIMDWYQFLLCALIAIFGAARILDSMRQRRAGTADIGLIAPLFGVLLLAIFQLIPIGAEGLAGGVLTSVNGTVSIDPRATRDFILIFASYIICGETLLFYARSRGKLAVIVSVAIALGAGSALFGLAKMFAFNELPRLGSEYGGFAQFAVRNHFAFLMEMTLALLLALVAFGRLDAKCKALIWSITAVVYISIIFSQSRGGLAVVMVITIAIAGAWLNAVFSQRKADRNRSVSFSRKGLGSIAIRVALIAAVASALVAIAAFAIALIGGEPVVTRFERLQNEVGESEGHSVRRTDIWASTTHLIAEKPLIGTGFGSYPLAITLFDSSSGEFELQHAHNEYLDILAGGGIGALALFGLFMVMLIRRASAALTSSEGRVYAASLGSTLGIAGVAIHSLVDFGLRVPLNAFVFILLVVIVAGRRKPEKDDGQRSSRLSAVFLLPLIVAYALLAVFSSTIAASNFFALRSSRSSGLDDTVSSLRFDGSNRRALAERARILTRSGNGKEAIETLRSAVKMQPNDYGLWNQLGTTEARLGDLEAAESSLTRANELAPNYAKPKWQLGTILLEKGDDERAFLLLGQAADIDHDLVDELFRLARERYGNSPEIDNGLRVASRAARKRVAALAIQDRIESASTNVFLTSSELTNTEKQEFVFQLLDKKNIALAFRVWASIRADGTTGPRPGQVINGNFEEPVEVPFTGFGWKLISTKQVVSQTIRDSAAANGSKSLEVVFNGESDPREAFLYQLVPLSPNTMYSIAFMHRLNEPLVTGGLPMIEVLDAASNEPLAAGTFTSKALNLWQIMELKFRTRPGDGAVAIKFTRAACENGPCPAFGKLLIDDLSVSKE